MRGGFFLRYPNFKLQKLVASIRLHVQFLKTIKDKLIQYRYIVDNLDFFLLVFNTNDNRLHLSYR